jgi:hypothetical protein
MPVGDKAPKASTDPLGNDLGIDKTCKDNKALGGKNTSRFFISKSGSTMLFDDTAGKEKIAFFTKKGAMFNINDEKDVIAIYDSTKEVYLTMDAKNKKITLETKNGDIHMLCKNGKFFVDAKNIFTQTSQNQDHKATGTWVQKSGGTMDLKAGGTMTQKAPTIKLN